MGANDAFNLVHPSIWNRYKSLIDHLQSRFPTSPIVFTNMPPIHMFPASPRFMLLRGSEDLYRRVFVRPNDFPNVFFNDERINWPPGGTL